MGSASSPPRRSPSNLTWSVAGDLWVGDVYNGVEQFDSSGNLLELYQSPNGYGTISGEPGPAGNVWNADFYGT